MLAYIIRRLLLMIPTLLGIMIINFAIIQLAPGGPVEQVLSKLSGQGSEISERITQNRDDLGSSVGSQVSTNSRYKGAQGLDPDLIKELEAQFGLDKPLHEQFLIMMGNYLTFDFGESFFRDRKVVDLVLDKMPVSISLGLWTTLLVYLISIPLGIRKAVRDGSSFDIWTSSIVIVGYAIPGFIFAVLLLVLFAGGSYLTILPLSGLTSENWNDLPPLEKVLDYLQHIILPVTAMVVGGFASLTMLTKNSFLDQIGQQYVVTARAKGLTEKRILYGHVFRNAMLIVIAAFPASFIGVLFTGSVLIEVIFSLDGLGKLGFEAVFNRDYPIMFGTLYFFTLVGLLMNIVGDVTYMLVDPRIDFESREV
ncbi:microcin C ABC transporter permease YejB [Kiloniella laminariae]|uniref:microcin C ABC transporter permease YejB n=1 Tax=Kiloniella laminariae TaxID=454162 RepID=UPI00035C4058|nr:microcin C ABC transporter permease YejB [Kiloniella laminariae]